MGYSPNFSLVRTELNYETESPYIKGSQLLYTSSYGGRKWAFDIQDSLSLSVTDSSWTKMALFLEDSNGEGLSQIHYVTDNFTAESQLFSTSGYARLFIIDPPPTVFPDYTNEGWGPLGRNFTFNCSDYSSYELQSASYETNVPVFETYTDAMAYINGVLDISDALNYYAIEEEVEGTQQFNIYCDHCSGDWSYDGVSNEEHIDYRFMQIWVAPNENYTNPRVSLIKNPQLNQLRCNYKVYGDIEKIRVSYDGGNSWSEVNEIPWDYFYYQRTNEEGFIHYDKLGGGNILLYDSEEDADIGNPSDASNYGDKSQYYETTNSSGTVEISTTMSETNLRSFFQKHYILDRTNLRDVANALFDTESGGIWENIKQGIEMFGENPINAVAGLTYFPFSLTSVFTGATSANSIWFGGYELENIPCHILQNYNGYVDLPPINIVESFPTKDYRNYEPYCQLSIYVPFCGIQRLKLNKYIGKTLSIRYYFDITTGGCLACLFANGILTDFFNGMCGVQLPITLTDYSSYASSQIQNITELGTSIGMSGVGAVVSGSMGNPVGVATSLVGGATNVGKSVFNISQNSINNFNNTKGSSTAMINQYMPNYVYLIFEIVETEETPNLVELEGRASNVSGILSSFSGFLSVDSCNLKCPLATENEKNIIMNYLQSGIYI